MAVIMRARQLNALADGTVYFKLSDLPTHMDGSAEKRRISDRPASPLAFITKAGSVPDDSSSYVVLTDGDILYAMGFFSNLRDNLLNQDTSK